MDKREFERLYSECERALKRFIYYKSPGRYDGDDILQETLTAAFRKKDFVKPQSFKAWIIKIASNKIKDFYRAKAKLNEAPIEEADASPLVCGRMGLTAADYAAETVETLRQKDAHILKLRYYENLPEPEIAQLLGIPAGTVKSRLHTAKQNFKSVFRKIQEGEKTMKKLPEKLPDYTITKSDKLSFAVKWEETMGWFIIPRLGEKCSWAMYDFPEKKRSEVYELAVVGRASVHGIEGVEITAREYCGGQHETKPENREADRVFVAQLSDTHCRYLSESHTDENGVKRLYTFLDADEFISNWGYGEDNCGKEINISQRGIIKRDGNIITAAEKVFDVVGRYTVSMNGKSYDTVCVIDAESYEQGMATEQFIDKNGRTVLWRRFNRDDWQIARYKTPWSARLPDSEQLIINGQTFVHWYDCITDYVL